MTSSTKLDERAEQEPGYRQQPTVAASIACQQSLSLSLSLSPTYAYGPQQEAPALFGSMLVLRSAASQASPVGALVRTRLVLPTSQRQSLLAGCSQRGVSPRCSPIWATGSLRSYATNPSRPEIEDAEPVAESSASGAAPEAAADAFVHARASPAASNYPAVIYVGPVSKAFRFLK